MLRNLLLISFVWAIIILIVSGLPGEALPDIGRLWFPHFDKLVHMGLYFPLAFFLVAEFTMSKKVNLKKNAVLLTLVLVFLYGGSLELAQEYLFVDRSAEWGDVLSDLIGGVLGISIYYLIGKRLFKR